MGNLKSKNKPPTKAKRGLGAITEEPAESKKLRMKPPEASPSSSTQGEASQSASPPTTEVTADGQPAPTPRVEDQVMPPAENQPTSQTRAVIFSLEEDNEMKILQSWTKSFINDCQLISPSTISRDEEWRPDMEKSPIVIFYSSSSMSSIEKMKSHMENSVSRKGHQAVIVVIWDVQDSEDQVRSDLGISRFPQCELHVFTKTEWLLQDPRLQEMVGKIKQIRDILPGDSQKKMTLNKEIHSLKDSQNSGNGVIFFIQETDQEKSHWLEPMLRTDDKVDFTVTEISNIKDGVSGVEETRTISCILHFKKETLRNMAEISGAAPIDGKILEDLGHNAQRMVVVVDDVDDDGSEEDLRALYYKTKLSRSAPLLVFRREEKEEEFLAYFSSNNGAEVKAREKWSELRKSIQTRVRAPESCLPPDTINEKTEDTRNFTTVGIFSRSSSIDYSWMKNMLTSPDLCLPVSGVRPFCISNNQTLQIFEELNLCTFGILYHTKNRGRVNVTDVMDSLYDEELQTMSLILGQNNVIVVIDDLSDSSLRERNRILETQPSIKKYASNLLLVTEKEKKDEPRLLERLREALTCRDAIMPSQDPPPDVTDACLVTSPPEMNGKNDTDENASKSGGKVSNYDSQKEPESNLDSKKKPKSNQNSQKEPESNQNSQKEPESNQNSQKKPESNQKFQKESESSLDPKKKPKSNQNSQKEPESDQNFQKESESNLDPKKKPKSNQNSQKEPESKRESQKEAESNQDSQNEPETKRDSQKKLESNQDSKNKPKSNQDSQKEPESNQNSQQEPESNQDSRNEPECNHSSQKELKSNQDSKKQSDSNLDSQKEPGSNQDFQKEPKNNWDSQMEPISNQDAQKKLESNQDSQKELESHQESQKERQSNRDSQKKLKSNQDSKKKADSNLDSQKTEINQDSKKKLKSNQDSLQEPESVSDAALI